ncbi:hypothetical protein CEP54_007009 [Fusarium duplospermum]|uniref:Uncharacterized protein n=1 Tax=Fusarium duplospermum TaxID=1325734 RepID=A0A428Q3P7_9HYPO|nr:hypothetical protein CEP54_007009 [Fusarium duplospermum]
MDLLSIIASTITVVQAIPLTYNAIQHLQGLPKAFEEVQHHLPLVQETLQNVQQLLKDSTLDESAVVPVQTTVGRCKTNADSLLQIFQDIEKHSKNGKNGSIVEFYRARVLRLGKGHRVESLMKDLMKGLENLAVNQLFKTATQSQLSRLEDSINEMSQVEPSVPDSEFDYTRTFGTVQHIAQGGHGYQAVNHGQGQLNAFGANQYNSQGGTMNFEFNYYQPSHVVVPSPEEMAPALGPLSAVVEFVDFGTRILSLNCTGIPPTPEPGDLAELTGLIKYVIQEDLAHSDSSKELCDLCNQFDDVYCSFKSTMWSTERLGDGNNTILLQRIKGLRHRILSLTILDWKRGPNVFRSVRSKVRSNFHATATKALSKLNQEVAQISQEVQAALYPSHPEPIVVSDVGKIDEAVFGRFESVQNRVIILTIFCLLSEHSKELDNASQRIQNAILHGQVEAPLETEKHMSNLSEDVGRMARELLAVVGSLVSSGLTYLDIWTPEKRWNALDEFRSVRNRMLMFTPFSLWAESDGSLSRIVRFDGLLDQMTGVLGRFSKHSDGDSTTRLSPNLGHGAFATRNIGLDAVFAMFSTSTLGGKRVHDQLVQYLWDEDWKPRDDAQTAEWLSKRLKEDWQFCHAITDSLKFRDIRSREDAIPEAYQQTFSWVFERKVEARERSQPWSCFPTWLRDKTNEPYWITGKPGSGKSTLLKFILQHPQLRGELESWSGKLPLLTVSYYAWNAGSDWQKSRQGLIRTLLFQSLKLNPALVPWVAPRRWSLLRISREAVEQPKWEMWELEESLRHLLGECGKTMALALFIDGLDEFQVEPVKIKEQILDPLRVIYSQQGTKVCMASREWSEFDDVLHRHPKLRMQDLTFPDMKHYAMSRMEATRGFLELQFIFPNETEVLMKELLEKANGVFLWLTLVVKSLLHAASQGRGLHHLQALLNALPSNIADLYSSIWNNIEDDIVSDSSTLLAIVRAAHEPPDALTVWLADNSLPLTFDVESVLARDGARSGIDDIIKRRLSSNTRGILEMSSSGIVDFLHRTARDWAATPEVWARINLTIPQDFDPNLVLLRTNIILRRSSAYLRLSGEGLTERTMLYASRVADSTINRPKLISALDAFDDMLQEAYDEEEVPWITHIEGGVYESTFFGLAARFCVMPYLKHKVSDQSLTSLSSRKCISPLENAIFGKTDNDVDQIPLEKRLATIKFLLDHGESPDRACIHWPSDGEMSIINVVHSKIEIPSQALPGSGT